MEMELTDVEWNGVKDLLPKPARHGRRPKNRRALLNGILFVEVNHLPWREMPEEYGDWRTAWRLYDRLLRERLLIPLLVRLPEHRAAYAKNAWMWRSPFSHGREFFHEPLENYLCPEYRSNPPSGVIEEVARTPELQTS